METLAWADAEVFGPPVAVVNGAGVALFVILCDHASNRIPEELRNLGLGAAERQAHIAWDQGALAVSRELARSLDAPLVHATLSRLVIDCNRSLDAPDLIAATSETTPVPGNLSLSEAERRRRIAAVHEPYHRAIERLLDQRLAAGRETALVAVHSFTPVFRGVARPWDAGVLFNRDRSLADPLIAALSAEAWRVGENEPYSPADGVYYTLSRHAEARGLASVMIEIRSDLLAVEEHARAWGARLAAAVGPFRAKSRECE